MLNLHTTICKGCAQAIDRKVITDESSASYNIMVTVGRHIRTGYLPIIS